MVTLLSRAQKSGTAAAITPTRDLPWGTLAWLLVILLGQGLILLDVSGPVRTVVGLFVVVGFPWLVLWRRVQWRSDVGAFYALAAVLLGSILVALLINTGLGLLGDRHPLTRTTIGISSTFVDVVLLLFRPRIGLVNVDAIKALPRTLLAVRLEPVIALASLSVVLAVLGAIRLNNDLDGLVAMLARIVGAVALVLLMRPGKGRWRDHWVLYLVGLALLLSTSLRGWGLVGHDVTREYVSYLLTLREQRWDMSLFSNAYHACLSVNLLPLVFTYASGLHGHTVFKVLMQALFALVPVLVYQYSLRMVSRRPAALAGVSILAFPTFVTDMPFLVRQEVAFLFVMALLLAGTERAWERRRRWVFVVAAAVGVVVSHYSTTYALLMMLGAASAGYFISGLWGRRRNRPVRLIGPVLLNPLLIVVLFAAAWVWANPATNSGGHALATARETIGLLIDGKKVPGSSDLKFSVFKGSQATPQQRLDLYALETVRIRKADPPGTRVLADSDVLANRVRAVPLTDTPITPAGRRLAAMTGLNTHTLVQVVRTGAGLVIQVMLLLGLVALLFRRGFAWHLTRRFGRETTWLSVGGVAGVGAFVLVPGLSVEYGVLRAFQQQLLFTAPVVAIGCLWFVSMVAPKVSTGGPTPRPLRAQWGNRALIPGLFGLLLVLNGVLPTALGGYGGDLGLGNRGLYYLHYYVTPQERAAQHWLARTAEGASVQTEVISEKLTLGRMEGNYLGRATVAEDYFPTLLRPQSYVFLGLETTSRGEGSVFHTGTSMSYRYPMQVLNSNYDLVYSNADARIYH